MVGSQRSGDYSTGFLRGLPQRRWYELSHPVYRPLSGQYAITVGNAILLTPSGVAPGTSPYEK